MFATQGAQGGVKLKIGLHIFKLNNNNNNKNQEGAIWGITTAYIVTAQPRGGDDLSFKIKCCVKLGLGLYKVSYSV